MSNVGLESPTYEPLTGLNHVSHQARQAVVHGLPPRSRRQGLPSAFLPSTEKAAELAGKKVVWQPIGRLSNPGGASKLNGGRKSLQVSRISSLPARRTSAHSPGGDPSRSKVAAVAAMLVSPNGLCS